MDWLDKEPEYSINFFIVANDKGEYEGIVSLSNFFSRNHKPETLIGSLIKRKYISVQIDNSLRTAVEVMAKENIDVLPVLGKTNDNVIGLLSYKNIIASYKHGMEDHTKKRPGYIGEEERLEIISEGSKTI